MPNKLRNIYTECIVCHDTQTWQMTVKEFVRKRPHAPCGCGNGFMAITRMKERKETA